MQAASQTGKSDYTSVARRTGYGAAVLVNLIILWVVHNLLEWDFLPFLTEEFAQLVPWITFSLLLTMAANFAYMAFDDANLRYVGEILVSVVSIIVTWRILVVYPFDFSYYDFNWGIVARVLLILAMVGAAVGVVSNLARMINGQASSRKGGSDAYGI